MNNEIFEVSRDQYVGLLDQIKPASRVIVQEQNQNYIIIKCYGKTNNKLLCERYAAQNDDVQDKFYIYDLPENQDWQPAKPKLKVTLQTREEVQDFFNCLAQLHKEKSI